ncbi:MAG: glycoside hydrolase family 71/99 protein, partial [Acidimicrobiales bacterium]
MHRRAVVLVVAVCALAAVSMPRVLARTTSRPSRTYRAQALAGPMLPTSPGGPGYWMVAGDGGVFSFGNAVFRGSTGGTRLAAPIVGLLPSPTGRGYWLAAADGGVFAFGDAPFLGSAVHRAPGAAPIVAIAGTPTGGGYWLFASDGFVYTLGDATYWGQPPKTALHAPIVGAAAAPSGTGYYLVAADGSVYPEGDAWALGDASDVHLGAPIVAITVSPGGRGYWLVGADGGVLAYGDARFAGSMGGRPLGQPVIGLTPSQSGGGYWLIGADGGAFAFGDAPYIGSAGGTRLARPVVAARSLPAVHGTSLATFFYPWYGTPAHDGGWHHWDEGGHLPPDDVGSDYYPLRGAYSSADPAVLDSQMGELQASGINEAVVSWWGAGSYEDNALPAVIAAAANHGIAVGIHLEPYVGRSPASVTSDFAHFQQLGITDVWVYLADEIPASVWVGLNDGHPSMRTLAESGDVGWVKAGGLAPWAWTAHFRGVYIYDAINYEGRDDTAFCASARAYGLVCAPVAAPGFVAIRATAAGYGRSREDGSTYDRRWMGAVGSRPDVVAITSYNEWHEG